MTPSPFRPGQLGAGAARWTAAVALITAVLAACSGSPPTASGYFEDLSAQLTGFSESVTEMQVDFGDDLSGQLGDLHGSTDFGDLASMVAFFDQAGELVIVKTADLFSETGSELRSLVDGLDALEPTPELEVAHDDLITAGSDLVAAVPAATESVRNLDSIDQLGEALDGSEFAAASQRFAIACTNLAAAADAAGVAELECPDLLVITRPS